MLKSLSIKFLADVRSFPGSRKFPHFKKENLQIFLPEKGIQYLHLQNLGGRRKANPDSSNTVWRHPAFRGYADYMETEAFKQGIKELERTALANRTAMMCSEAVWWSCHRSMISDYFKAAGWEVMHIMGEGKATEHPFTQPAKVVNGKLTYSE